MPKAVHPHIRIQAQNRVVSFPHIPLVTEIVTQFPSIMAKFNGINGLQLLHLLSVSDTYRHTPPQLVPYVAWKLPYSNHPIF